MFPLCFSAPASFTASALLILIGILSLNNTRNAKSLPFRLIPILFAAQQLIEGFVWISFQSWQGSQWGMVFIYIFLIFAMVVWPIWVPFSMWTMERKKNIKSMLFVLFMFGSYQGVYLLYCIMIYPVSATVQNNHIAYAIQHEHQPLVYNSAYYFIVTVFPGIFSGEKRMLLFTFMITLSFMISYLFFKDEIISVWCFFSALLSAFIYWSTQKPDKKNASLAN